MTTKDAFRYVCITGVLGVLFIPFIIANNQFFPFITGKGFTFRILIEILFGIWLVGMFFDASLRPRFSWILGSILAFIAIIAVADIFGVSFYRSFWSDFERMDGLINLLNLLMFFLVASSVFTTRKSWNLFFNVSVVTSVIMTIYAFVQLSGKLPINQGGVRVDGTFGNATYLAVYMLFNIFITLFLALRAFEDKDNEARWIWLTWYGVALVMQLIVIYETATRGDILGLIGGLFISALYVIFFGKSQPRLRKAAISLVVAILVLTGGFFAIRHTSFATNSKVLARFSSLSIQDFSTQGRAFIWPMALKGFKERPILGWGQENFGYVFAKYYDPKMYNQEPWFDRAHNIILDWLVDGGLLGLLGYLSLFVALLCLIWKSKTLTLGEKSLLVGLVVAYFFQNLFVFDNLISYVYFFMFLAFVHVQSVEGKSEPKWLARFANDPLTQKVASSVAIVLVIFIIYFLNVNPILANRHLLQALQYTSNRQPDPAITNTAASEFQKALSYDSFGNEEIAEQMYNSVDRFSSQDVKPETKQLFVKTAIDAMDADIKQFPGNTRSLLFIGSFRNRLGDHQNALPYLQKALATSPKKQSIIFEIGFAYLGTGDYKNALAEFKLAYDLEPDYSESKILYGIAALYNKNNDLANQLFAKVDESIVVSDERILSAYAGTGQTPLAVRLLARRVELDPQNPDIRFRLAAGYLLIGQRALAVATLQTLETMFPAQKDRADYYIKEIQAGRNP